MVVEIFLPAVPGVQVQLHQFLEHQLLTQAVAVVVLKALEVPALVVLAGAERAANMASALLHQALLIWVVAEAGAVVQQEVVAAQV